MRLFACLLMLVSGISAQEVNSQVKPDPNPGYFAAGAMTPMSDPNCDGNACSDIRLSWENNCHVARNAGSRPIKFTWGAFSCYLKGGESCSMKGLDGKCVGSVMGKPSANYDN